MQHWEDLAVGQVFKTDSITISANDIIEYASDYDPQPYHLDPVVAESSIFGGHCASGWQVCALMMRLLVDTMKRDGISASSSTGVSSLRWLKPVFANDSLNADIEVVEKQTDSSHTDYGLVDLDINVRNQHDKSVIVLTTSVMIKKVAADEQA